MHQININENSMYIFEDGRVNDPTAPIESIEFLNLISEFDNPE